MLTMLYDAQIVKPLSGTSMPRRLGSQTVAWCEGLDLIATVSGCGGVAVFHADAPGENTLLYSQGKAPARHVAWRPARRRAPLLLIADAFGSITFWATKDNRVNIWKLVGKVAVKAAVMAASWARDASIVAAVLSDGTICVWHVLSNDGSQFEIRPLEPSRRTPEDRGRLNGPVKCASIVASGAEEDVFALVAVLEKQPSTVSVMHICPSRDSDYDGHAQRFDLRPLGSATFDDEIISSCMVASPARVLYASSETGKIQRWTLERLDGGGHNASAESMWTKSGMYAPEPTDGSRDAPAITAIGISSDGNRILLARASVGLLVLDGRQLAANSHVGSALESSSHVHSSVCFSPSGLCIIGLNRDGVAQMRVLTDPPPAPRELAEQLMNRTTEDGRRGCWDVLALLVKLGKDFAAAVATTLSAIYRDEKIDTLRLAVLSAVDANTAAVSAARKLLESAVDAIRSSSNPVVVSRLSVGNMDPRMLCTAENIRQVIKSAVMTCSPSLNELSAAPLADWIILLCIVWLRRVACAVERKQKNLMGAAWSAVVEADGGVANELGDRTSIIKDPSLTKSLRNTSLAAAMLLALDDTYGDRDLDPCYHRLSQEEAADVVAALWDASIPAEGGVELHAEQIGYALARHTVAAVALNQDALCIESAEPALGIRGSACSAGFIMACARDTRSSVDNTQQPHPPAEWCPHDVVSGRSLPPWVPLRRCVSSGLIAAEMPAARPDSDFSNASDRAPWMQRWAYESPLGGLWARMPSLDLDRFELIPAPPYAEDRSRSGNQQTPDVAQAAQAAQAAHAAQAAQAAHAAKATQAAAAAAAQSIPAAGDRVGYSTNSVNNHAQVGVPERSLSSSTAAGKNADKKPTAKAKGKREAAANPSNNYGDPAQYSADMLSVSGAVSGAGNGERSETNSTSQRGRGGGKKRKVPASAADKASAAAAAGNVIESNSARSMPPMCEASSTMANMRAGVAPRGQAPHAQPPSQQAMGLQNMNAMYDARSTVSAMSSMPFQAPMHQQMAGQQSRAPPPLPQSQPPAQASMNPHCIWQGSLHVRGAIRNMAVRCVATAHALPHKTPLTSVRSWPAQLLCDSTKVSQASEVKAKLVLPHSQWYARFSPIDEHTMEEIQHPKLIDLMKVMHDRKLAFGIDCNEHPTDRGTLYLFSMISEDRYSLIGVYTPHVADAR